MRNCSILIPTFNGREILAECLPTVIADVESRGGGDEIIILDNASCDGTRAFIEEEYPLARVVVLTENKAIFALNDGARAAKHEYLFFLNNDMLLKPGCISSLLDSFEASDVFAVTGKVYQWDGRTVQAARRRPAFNHGYFWYLPAKEPDAPGITLHALGGQSVFHREKFLSLGGLDPLFSPFYHEDLDISWRALKRGWRILYEPHAEMIHKGAATAGKMFTKLEIETIMRKNLFLFMWKNLRDPALANSVRFWTAPRAMRAAATGDRTWLTGFTAAMKQAAAATKAGKAEKKTTLSDTDVFRLFGEEPKW
jgi:GT2 family glycosyltransferase